MDSKSYWKNREEENLRSNLKEEEEYVKEINRIYDRMMVQITKEINDFYVRYAKKEGISISEARKRVKKLDINAYAEKAKKYVKEKDFSDEANEEMRLYNLTMKVNRLELLKAQIGLELVDNFNDLQKYFDEKLTKRTLDEFKRQAGILGKTLLDNEKAAHAVVNASFHNATFSDRIWLYQGLLKNDLYKLLQTGIVQGKNPRVLAADLVKKFDVSRYNAERLMRTELARVQTEAQKQSFERNGYDEYEYIACGKSDVCDICKALDGKHFKVKDMMVGENAPPMHPMCHCSVAAHMDRGEYEAWLDYLDKGGTTEEWNKLKNREKSFAKKFDSGIIKEKKVLESKAYSSAIKAEEKKIYKDNVETAVLFDNRGNVIFRESSGASNYVKFSKEQLSRMQGATLTHNHPSSSTFSPADIAIVTEQRLEVIRATGVLKTYQLKEIKGAKVNHAFSIDYEKAMNENKKITDKEFRTYKKQYKQGELSPLEYQEKINMLNKKWNDMNSDWLKKNSKNYGYRYGVIERGK